MCLLLSIIVLMKNIQNIFVLLILLKTISLHSLWPKQAKKLDASFWFICFWDNFDLFNKLMWGKDPPQAFPLLPPPGPTQKKKTQLNQQKKPLWTKENFEWQGNETMENLIR